MPGRRPCHEHAPANSAITTARLENGSCGFVHGSRSSSRVNNAGSFAMFAAIRARLVFRQVIVRGAGRLALRSAASRPRVSCVVTRFEQWEQPLLLLRHPLPKHPSEPVQLRDLCPLHTPDSAERWLVAPRD